MRIVFRAIGELTNPMLLNVNTREFIKLNYTMVAGDVVEINTSYGSKRQGSPVRASCPMFTAISMSTRPLCSSMSATTFSDTTRTQGSTISSARSISARKF